MATMPGMSGMAGPATPLGGSKGRRRALVVFRRSPLARRIVAINLLAILILVAGVLVLDPYRDASLRQRQISLIDQAELVADVFEARLAPHGLPRVEGPWIQRVLDGIDLGGAVHVTVLGEGPGIVATATGRPRREDGTGSLLPPSRSAVMIERLDRLWAGLRGLWAEPLRPRPDAGRTVIAELTALARDGRTHFATRPTREGGLLFAVATPIMAAGERVGVVALASGEGEIDALMRAERGQVLQLFLIAIVVSVGLSVVLASTIANPLADLARAAEVGREKPARDMQARVAIPDLSDRPDEIGRLSRALRGMVAALYDRIDSNEQFAADVAHEIKNPLASLRSAVETLRRVEAPELRSRLLEVIAHDVRRLDRLVSDISSASRLDSDLVREEEETFDLARLLRGLCTHFTAQARRQGVELIADLPDRGVVLHGLESRLAQVFVNLISNAISFCEPGGAIRVWARSRERRVLVVVEDTGPGIPEAALERIFERFYSERPEGQFGDNSGLGLSISKQIVEAHGGVIWAENIRDPGAAGDAPPLGARLVVGLPT